MLWVAASALVEFFPSYRIKAALHGIANHPLKPIHVGATLAVTVSDLQWIWSPFVADERPITPGARASF
jgi:hypothetical protein